MVEFDMSGIYTRYGSLNVREIDGEFYWGIPDYDGIDFQQIPEYLYQALKRFEDDAQRTMR